MASPHVLSDVRMYSSHESAGVPYCRGIVTTDVLGKGLSRGAIATRKLKGVNRDKGHEVYTSLPPYGEGKDYGPVLSGIAYVSITRQRIA